MTQVMLDWMFMSHDYSLQLSLFLLFQGGKDIFDESVSSITNKWSILGVWYLLTYMNISWSSAEVALWISVNYRTCSLSNRISLWQDNLQECQAIY